MGVFSGDWRAVQFSRVGGCYDGAVLVIAEGLDLTGKTFLLDHLAELNPGSRLHALRPERHPLEEYEVPLASYVPGFGHFYVDRWHVGETVWPRVFNRPTELDDEAYMHIEMFLRSRGAVLVLAEASEAAIYERMKQREEPIAGKDVGFISRAFKFGAYLSILPVVPYDFERDRFLKKTAEVIATATRLESEVFDLHEVTFNWVGDPAPEVLYVGERPGNGPGTPRSSCNVPFTPYRGTSGWYLMHSLPTHDGLAIVNAFERDGQAVDLDTFHFRAGSPPTVALGNVAHEQLDKFGVPHGVVPHPQFVRRFHHARSDDYTEALQLAAGGEDRRGDFK